MKDDAIIIFEKVLNHELPKFPRGYWQQENAKDNARTIMTYLVREKLKWSDTDIEENLNVKIAKQYRLYSMICAVYGRKFDDMTKDIFPNLNTNVHKNVRYNEIDIYELYEDVLKGKKNFPLRFWKSKGAKEVAICLVRYLLKDKLKLNDSEIVQVTCSLLEQYKLGGSLELFGKVELLSTVFPELEIVPITQTKEHKEKISEIFLNLSPDKREKIKHGARHNRYTKEYGAKLSESQKGENNNQSKLKEDQVRKIKQMWSTGLYTSAVLGEMFGVKRQTVNDIVFSRTWKHVE